MKKAFTMEQTWLQCMDCGHKADLLAERKFLCPKCGGLFDVEHDFQKVKSQFEGLFQQADQGLSMSRLIKQFNQRSNLISFFTQNLYEVSGVWRFRELLMPFLPYNDIVSLGEGNVPIIPAGKNLRKWIGGDIDLRIILEGMTPTGSFKDFGGTVMMSVAKASGIKSIACASTGDTSAMAAAYAAVADIQCAVILPRGKVTPVQLAQPLLHGAKVITLPGNFDDCMKVIKELVAKEGVYPANSINPTRIEGHQATVFLIAQSFSWKLPDWIAVPIGNGSNCSSIGKALRLLKKMGLEVKTRILGCQSVAAYPLTASWRPGISQKQWEKEYRPTHVTETTATAARIGNPASYKKVIREIIASNGAMMISREQDLNTAVAICGKDGINVCPQTGIALTGVMNAVESGLIKKGETVVVVSTATGLKFADSAAANLQKNIIQASDCKTSTVAKIMGL